MKNVAGYDVSRLVCGSYGMLGVIADVSLKVLPVPPVETSVVLSMNPADARTQVQALRRRVSPLSGACYRQADSSLYLRFSGSEQAVSACLNGLGGEPVPSGFWQDLDSLALPEFQQAEQIWRLSCAAEEPDEPQLFQVMDWAFSQRWLLDPADNPREHYRGAGHWTCYRGGGELTFQPLDSITLTLHQRLKHAFDPSGMFNPGRMYPEL